MEFVDRANVAFAKWPVWAPHSRLSDSDVTSKDDETVDDYCAGDGESGQPSICQVREAAGPTCH